MNKVTVDEYILKSGVWQPALNMLRELMRALEMEETVKWGIPVYCIDGKNVVSMASFKAYTGLWFYQGVFLEDPHGKLVSASEGSTRGMRQWRFQSADGIEAELDLIIAYVKEAIENARSGKEIKPRRNEPFTLPPELKEVFTADPELEKLYKVLSYSKRRDFARYIDQAKRPETRKKRLDKSLLLIREGKGLMDQYK
jgi:uncharacterized protein YdeI (YjbR/CyaY-like superfamily)